MLKCQDCVYSRSIQGNAHIKCAFDWVKSGKEMPELKAKRAAQWFRFPYNYDPIWSDYCNSFSETEDPEMTKNNFNPIEELLSIMG